jgi:hypothetical protein
MPNQRFVDARTLRRMFNDGQYWERLQAGQLVGVVAESRHPGPSFEPFCTFSQIVRYFTPTQERVAVVHQYLRPDGTIGGSGRPDPKAISTGGVLYILDPAPGGQQQAPSPERTIWARRLVQVAVGSIMRLITRVRRRRSPS